MGYKNIKPRLMHLDSLAVECRLFINEDCGCKSKSKQKQEEGKCYGFDCPLAYPAYLEDLKKHDKHLYEEYKKYHKGNLLNNDTECGDWMIQYRAIV